MSDHNQHSVAAPEKERTSVHLIVLVHGIRDYGEAQDLAKEVLEQIPGVVVTPLGYDRFDPFRFVLPGFGGGPRRVVARNIKQQIALLERKYDDVKLSIVAHSFGTHVVMGILEEEDNMELEYLILCGTVLPRLYNFRNINRMVKHKIINYVGCRDIWPVIAKLCSFGGYGQAGTFGFQSAGPDNRYFDFGHSGCFTPEFIENNWRKVLEGNDIEAHRTPTKRTYPPLIRWLGSLFNGALTIAVVGAVAMLFYFTPLGYLTLSYGSRLMGFTDEVRDLRDCIEFGDGTPEECTQKFKLRRRQG
jgi:hypothetical protein